MHIVRYSRKADQELDEIVAFTQKRWGQLQAEEYLDGLVDTSYVLAKHPSLGRPYSGKKPTWRRFEYISHVIFYQPISSGVRIQRIVHQSRALDKVIR
jgi:toxin ParE1/3/4